jgi:hypothetical protein
MKSADKPHRPTRGKIISLAIIAIGVAMGLYVKHTSSIRPSTDDATIDAVGRIVSIAAPIVTQTLAVSIGVAHAIQLSAFIWLSLILGYWLSHETRGTEIVDRVVKRSEMAPAMPALGAGSGTERVGPARARENHAP